MSKQPAGAMSAQELLQLYKEQIAAQREKLSHGTPDHQTAYRIINNLTAACADLEDIIANGDEMPPLSGLR